MLTPQSEQETEAVEALNFPAEQSVHTASPTRLRVGMVGEN